MGDALFHFPFEPKLREGRLLRRYHRFLSDVELDDGSVVVAHCVNSGSMEGLVRKGSRVWLQAASAPGRKLAWTWELCEYTTPLGSRIVGANTSRPNQIVRAMLEAEVLPGVAKGTKFAAEKKYGVNSRIDFYLEEVAGPRFVEVKNCHLVYPDGIAYFPDSVSIRATKHLEELSHLARSGTAASVLFFVQRSDAASIRPSDLHDPAFAAAARKAAEAGVSFHALRVRPEIEGIVVEGEMPVDLAPYDCAPMEKFRLDEKPHSGWERPKSAKQLAKKSRTESEAGQKGSAVTAARAPS